MGGSTVHRIQPSAPTAIRLIASAVILRGRSVIEGDEGRDQQGRSNQCSSCKESCSLRARYDDITAGRKGQLGAPIDEPLVAPHEIELGVASTFGRVITTRVPLACASSTNTFPSWSRITRPTR